MGKSGSPKKAPAAAPEMSAAEKAAVLTQGTGSYFDAIQKSPGPSQGWRQWEGEALTWTLGRPEESRWGRASDLRRAHFVSHPRAYRPFTI